MGKQWEEPLSRLTWTALGWTNFWDGPAAEWRRVRTHPWFADDAGTAPPEPDRRLMQRIYRDPAIRTSSRQVAAYHAIMLSGLPVPRHLMDRLEEAIRTAGLEEARRRSTQEWPQGGGRGGRGGQPPEPGDMS